MGGGLVGAVLLFHGPGAQQRALQEQASYGVVPSPPLGEFGLSVDEARKVVELTQTPSIGDSIGSVVVGPMDLASPSASDILLKTLEDLREDQVQPLLWARDLEAVRPTIRSRCQEIWCHGPEEDPSDSLMNLSFDLVDATVGKDRVRVLEIVSEGLKDVDLQQLTPILARAVQLRMVNPSARLLEVWMGVRALLAVKRVGRAELLLHLLEA